MCHTQTPYHTVCGHYGKPTFTSGSPCIRAQTIKGYTNGCEYTENHVQSTNSTCIACSRENGKNLFTLGKSSSSTSISSMASAATTASNTSTTSTISSASLRSLQRDNGTCGSWSYKGGEFFEASSSLHWRTCTGVADNAKGSNGNVAGR
ncbi:hypothetical protein AC579_1383 [Pseudocercospora musae]|uniref:Uncharacterized protein n=1 Tax=Pseudocercospora musae TaxID=113226 RepID=A0A139IKE1_9PEZI|nr:hypothetical protein AC579_1383 [Pseudocercospora musae]